MNTKDLWNLYADELKQFIFCKVKHADIADDLLQETFIKVHTKLHFLKDDSKVKAWLFSIARYTVMDYFRTHHNTSELSDKGIILDERPLEHTREDCLHGIIKSLPNKYRIPLFLFDIQGMKQVAISEQLELPLPTVKSQIQRARKMIAQGFVACCDFKMNDEGYLVGELKDKKECKICRDS